MRNKLTYILFLLALLAGCSDSVEYNPDMFAPSLRAKYLSVSQNSFELPDAGIYKTDFSVTSMDTPWGFTEVMDWIGVSVPEGEKTEKVELSVEENLSGDNNRLGVFYLESRDQDWDYAAPLSVYQPAAEPYARPADSSLTFDGNSSIQEVAVTANCTWECDADVQWITLSKGNESAALVISVSENLADESRTGHIYLTFNSELLAAIDIIQKPSEVSMETDTLYFENTAGAYELKLVSEASWTAYASHSWLEVSPDSGQARESVIRISALENYSIYDRTGYVYVRTGDVDKVEIPVHQSGLYLEFNEESLSFSSHPGEQAVGISTNTSWTIESCPDWITVSEQSGSGSRDVIVKVKDNPNLTSRKATIVVTHVGLDLSSKLIVSQDAKEFSYGTVSTFECSDKAQKLIVNVTTDGTWVAISNDSWLSVSPASMTGSSELNITVEENLTDSSRTGSVTLTIGDQSYTLTIIQTGKYFTIDYSETDFTSKETNLSIDVVTNDSWTARLEGASAWITLSQTSGEGNATLVAAISDNPSVNKRSDNIIVETPNGKSVKIPVSQSARYMKVDNKAVNFYSLGGTSADITISTDAQYSITCSDGWFAVTEKGCGTFCVTAEENLSKQKRTGSVTVAMTDLKEGTYSISIPVLQAEVGAICNVIGYGEDKNYDIATGEAATISVIGYGTEIEWDDASSLTVTVTGYTEDKNLDCESSSSDSVTYDDYSDDNDYDSSSSDSDSVSYGGFTEDKNWNE